jgi:hypothetical protein
MASKMSLRTRLAVEGNKFPDASYVRRGAMVQLKTPFGIHLGLPCL